MKLPDLSLKGKVVLITGATGGLGGAIAAAFAAAGATLFLHGATAEKLERLSRALAADGIESRHRSADLRNTKACEDLAAWVTDHSGRIDVLVNAAGINRPQNPEDVTETNWDDILDINLKGLFFVSQAAGRHMIRQGSGKIVNISSQAGSVALPYRAAYCSSKGGVDQLTRTLAYEWARHRINVNAVAPTFVLTPMTQGMMADETFKTFVLGSIPLGRMVTPEEVAYATLFLAGPLADMITGQILLVDGGWTIK
jgi:2-deoxy-D-gluconate 3-dehydrogenase